MPCTFIGGPSVKCQGEGAVADPGFDLRGGGGGVDFVNKRGLENH